MNEKWYKTNWFVFLMIILFFPVGLFLMWYFGKWNKTVRWIVTVAILLIASIAFITDDDSQYDTKSNDNKKENVSKKTDEDKKQNANKNNTKKDSKAKDNSKAKDSKKDKKSKDKKDEAITHTKQNGYDVYERDGGMPFSENSSVKHFSMEMSNKLKKDHKNINEGAVFKDVMEFEDKKGNESKMVAVVVYISKESIDEINFENWPKNPESLYDVADGVVFHAYINDNDVAETRDQDEIPQEFYDMLGEEK